MASKKEIEPAPVLGKPFLLQLTPKIEARVEKERIARGLKSRAETIRQLIEEALSK